MARAGWLTLYVFGARNGLDLDRSTMTRRVTWSSLSRPAS
jgi:hypothetical protein